MNKLKNVKKKKGKKENEVEQVLGRRTTIFIGLEIEGDDMASDDDIAKGSVRQINLPF